MVSPPVPVPRILARLLPELDRLWGVPQPPQHHPEVDTGVHQLLVLQQAAALQVPLPVRWACLMHDLGKGTTPRDLTDRRGQDAADPAARTVA